MRPSHTGVPWLTHSRCWFTPLIEADRKKSCRNAGWQLLQMTYQAAHKQEGAHRLPLCVAPQIHFQCFLSMSRRCLVGFDNVVNRRSWISKEKVYESQATKAAGACLEGPQPVSPAVCQCPAPLYSVLLLKKPRVSLPLAFTLTYLFWSLTTCAYARRLGDPTHSPYASETAERFTLATSSVTKKKKQKSSVPYAYLDWLPGWRQETI